MKMKLRFLSLLVMLFCLSYEFLPFMLPVVSSTGSAHSGSVSMLGTTTPINVETVQNFMSSINITGNMVISGNNVTRFAGISPSQRAKIYLNGSIMIQGNGTLILQYVTLYFVGTKDRRDLYKAGKDYSRNITMVDPVAIGLGQSGTFISQVSGGVSPYQYQWYFNNTIVPGANSSSWVFTPTSLGTFKVYVKVVDAFNMTTQSEFQLVTVKGSPLINVSVNPASAVEDVGKSVTFNSSVTNGTSPLSYQWYLNNSPVSGATQSTWTFTPALEGTYQVYLKVKDSLNVTGTSNVVPVLIYPIPQPPTVTINPASATIGPGQSGTFISQVSGGVSPYQYQWYLNGTPVSGATNPSWAFTPASSGKYEIYVEITDADNVVVQSAIVLLTVTSPPSINVTISPGLAAISMGGFVSFKSTVLGGFPSYNYLWYLDGNLAANTSQSTWIFIPPSTGTYQVYLKVKDSLNVIGTSNIVSVLVYPISVTVSPSYGTGHPSLIVLNATMVSSTFRLVRTNPGAASPEYANISLGCAIYARGNSEITGKELKFYRDRVYSKDAGAGRSCVLNCSDNSFVDLSDCVVDVVATYDNVHASINRGQGPSTITLAGAAHDLGIGFRVYNSSSVNAYGVNFNNSTVADNANMTLVHCEEQASCSLWTGGRTVVSFSGGTTLSPTKNPNRAGLNVTGNSFVTLNSCIVYGVRDYVGLAVVENGTLFVVGNSTIKGPVVVSDYAKVFMRGVNRPDAFTYGLWLDAYDYSNITLVNCKLWAVGIIYAYSIDLFNNSRLSLVNSRIDTGYIRLFDTTSFYLSNSTLASCRVLADDLVNVTFVDGCDVRNVVEMRGNSQLVVASSSVSILFGLGSSRIFLTNANVSMLDLKDVSKLVATSSGIGDALITASDASGSWAGLTNFFENSRLTLSSNSPDITLFNTYIYSLRFIFLGNSRVTIANSTIGSLSLQDSSVVTLWNVSAVWDSFSVIDNAEVYVSSSLRVRSVDYFGNPLSGANVTVRRAVGATSRVFKSRADKDGWAGFILDSAFINASGRFSVGAVVVGSAFGGVSESQRIDLGLVNKDVTVSLPLPSWSVYILPAVLIVAFVVILAVLSFVYNKFRKRR